MNKHIKLICLFVILLSIVVVGVALLTMANKNKEVENRITSFMLETAGNNGVLQIKVKHQNEKSPAKFARPKKGATNQTGEKVPHRPR